jgi:hypothetical protein
MSGVAIQSFSFSARDATRLASRLGVPMHEIELHRFPDRELRVTVGPAASTTVIYASFDRPNDKLLAVLFAAEALRRGGAKRLVLLAPYLCYMRQDIAFQKGEAISQKIIGRLLAGIVDRVVTVDAHFHRTTSITGVFPGIDADNLSAMPAIADAQVDAGLDQRTVVVGPDAAVGACAFDRVGPGPVLWGLQRQGDAPAQVVDRRRARDRHKRERPTKRCKRSPAGCSAPPRRGNRTMTKPSRAVAAASAARHDSTRY